MNQRELEVTALCDGAATLTKGGNRIASLALLWAAVGIAPTHLRAHRNLAAALANNGDLNAAAEEYARFVEFMLKAGEYQRAALELVYANSSLGHQAALVKVGRELIPARRGRRVPGTSGPRTPGPAGIAPACSFGLVRPGSGLD